MELTQLEQFVAICEHDYNVTKAAESVFITQSALSKAVSRLEEELDVQLFERKRKRFSITNAGKILLEHAYNILGETKKMDEAIEPYKKNKMPLKLNFCSNDSSAYRVVLPAFRETHPDIEIYNRIFQSAEESVESVLKNESDIAFTYDYVKHPLFYCIPIYGDHLALRVPTDHPLVKKTSASLDDLKDLKIITLIDSGWTKEYMARFQKDNDINLNLEIFTDPVLYYAKVSSNKCVSLTCFLEKQISNDEDYTKYIRISGVQTLITYYALYLKSKIKQLKPFIDFIRNDYKKINEVNTRSENDSI